MNSTPIIVVLVLVGSATFLSAAGAQAPKEPELRMLSGCVTPSATSKKQFTLADAEQGETFRLTGTDVRQFVGKHVQIFGTPPRGLVIKGGLYPSANVAGQAGAMDPAKAAIAAQGGPTANDPKPVLEFKVRSVRVTPGECPK